MQRGQACFPAPARLHQGHEFKRVFARGQKFVSAGLVVIAADSATPHARLGLALAKRHLRRAVERNRVKRVVRESFRRVRGSLGAVDIVVLARHRTAMMSNAELFAQLRGLWPQIARRSIAPAQLGRE
jgi:ribonuclease P protein component